MNSNKESGVFVPSCHNRQQKQYHRRHNDDNRGQQQQQWRNNYKNNDNNNKDSVFKLSTRKKNNHNLNGNNKRARGNVVESNKTIPKNSVESLNDTSCNDWDEQFPKLDQSNPVHSRRIQQRRRAIAMGKNTAGYDEYLKKVPKHTRKPRSMEYPTTPDYKLDIPTKRWQGLVRAWRRSLHQYDPPDLMKAFDEPQNNDQELSSPKKKVKKNMTTQERQLEEAAAQGLLVDLLLLKEATTTRTEDDSNKSDICSPVSLLTADSNQSNLSFMDAQKCFREDYDNNDDEAPTPEGTTVTATTSIGTANAGVTNDDNEDLLGDDDSDDDLI